MKDFVQTTLVVLRLIRSMKNEIVGLIVGQSVLVKKTVGVVNRVNVYKTHKYAMAKRTAKMALTKDGFERKDVE